MDIDAVLLEIVLTVTVHGVLAVLASVHAMINKRDPRAAIGWIAVCVLFPFAGPVIYYFLGINRVRNKARTLRFGRNIPAGAVPERTVFPPTADLPGSGPTEGLRCFFLISEKVTRRPVVGGNELEMFEGGEEAYPSMLEAISQARRSVYISTYIFHLDGTGQSFIDELERAHSRGVEVKVLLDGVGKLLSRNRAVGALKSKGIPVARFLPPAIFPPSFSINLRNHRKILTIDSAKGFAGGMNIGDNHLLSGDDPQRVRDVHFMVAGSVVRQLEHAFLEDWNFAVGGAPPPAPEDTGKDPWEPVSCRTIVDGPDENLNKIADILVGAVSAARESVTIITPYFLPPREMISALNSAALRGVEVTIILPEKNNMPFIHWATRNLLWELLLRDVKIVYQPPPFAHTKLFVVDNLYSIIGSANIDPRSLRLNFEIGVEIFDEEFSSRLGRYCEEVAARSRAVTLEEVDGRPFTERLRDSFFWLLAPYL